MFPPWATHGWLQPFRFIDLPEASKNALPDQSAVIRSAAAGVPV
jgi:hypothetical protein